MKQILLKRLRTRVIDYSVKNTSKFEKQESVYGIAAISFKSKALLQKINGLYRRVMPREFVFIEGALPDRKTLSAETNLLQFLSSAISMDFHCTSRLERER